MSLQKAKQGPTQPPPPLQQATNTSLIQTSAATTQLPNFHRGVPQTGTRIETQDVYNRTVVYSQQPRPPLHPGTVPQGGIAHDLNKQHFTSQAGIPTSSIPQQTVHHSTAAGMYQGQVPVRQQTSAPSGVQSVAHQQTYHHRPNTPSRQMQTMPGPPTRQPTVSVGINVLSTPQNSGTPPNFYPGNAAQMFLQQQPHVQQMPQAHIMYQPPHPSSMQGPVEISPSSEGLSVSFIQQHPSQRYTVDNADMSSSGMPYRFGPFGPQGTPTVMYSQHQPVFSQNTLYFPQMVLANTNRPNVAPITNVQQPQQAFKREKKLLSIVDPLTNRNIIEDLFATSGGSGNPTPPHSGASSARGTPPSNATPPPTCQEISDIPAQFARQVAAAAAGAAEPIADPIKDQQHHPLSQPQAQLPGVSGIVPSQVVTGVVAPQASPDTINTDIVVCTTSDSVSTSVSDAIHRNQAVTKVTDVSVNGTIQNQQDKSEAVVLSDGSASDVHRVISSKSSGIHSNVGDVSDDRASGLIKKSELSKSEKPATSIPSSIVNSTRGHCVLSSSCSSETVDVESPTTLPQLQQPPIIVSLPPHSRTRCGSENVKQGPPQSTPPFPVQKAAPPDTTVLQPRSDKEVCIKFGTIDDILPQSVMSDKQQVLSPPLAIKLPTGPASGVTELPLTAMRPSGAPPGMPTHPIAHSAANKQLTSQVVQPKVVVPHPKQPSPTLPAADPVPPPPPPLLQVHPKQNGEMVEPDNDNVDIADSADVAAKDPKNQKCKRKGKDSTKKGETKESGEMNANLDKDKPAVPQEITPQVNTAPTIHQKPPIAQEEDKGESNEEAKLAEELIDKEEQRKVAEKNEENVKVSQNLAQQETQQKDVPVIKEPETSSKPTLTLPFSYKEDQWSPTNPLGKMQYGREFLLMLQQQPMSRKKPEGLPDLEVIVATNKPRYDRNSSNMFQKSMSGSQGSVPDFIPNYLSNNSRPQARGKSSQLGRKEPPPPKKVVSISLSQDVKLHKSEDAWRPTHKSSGAEDPEKEKTDRLYRRVRALLNKLTPQNFPTLMGQVVNFEINTEERLAGVIDLIFEKAIDEPNFSFAYANMCKKLSSLKVPIGTGEEFNFKKLMITKCQREFEKTDNEHNEKLLAERSKAVTAETDEKQKELIEEVKELIRKSKLRSLGNIRFIGELFKLHVLTSNIMHDCIQKLIGEKDEDSIECLCRLLTTIGKDLDKPGKQGQPDPQMEQYFKQLRELSLDKKHLSSRVRFMLQDVIELRQQKWIPRRDENNPKTIDQIHREAEKEQMDKQAMFSQPLPISKRSDERRGGAMSGSGKRGGSTESDGWNTVGSGKRTAPSVDPGKTRITRPPDLDDNNVQLGPRGGVWGKGSSGGMKSSSQEGDRHLNNAPNRYSALAAEHGSPMDSRRNNSRQGTGVPSNRDSSKSRSSQLPPTSHRSAKVHPNKERTAAVAAVRNISNNEPRYQTSASRDSSLTREMERKDNEVRRSPPDLDKETMVPKAKLLIDEFLHLVDFEGAILEVSELCSSSSMVNFVGVAVNEVIERSTSARRHLGKLFSELVKKQIVTIDQYHQGMQELLECAEDICIDVPMFWEYMAEIFSPMLESGAMKWTSLKDYAHKIEKPGHVEKFLSSVIIVASKEMGKSKVSEFWRTSGLSFSDFFSPGDLQRVLTHYNLDYLEDARSTVDDRLSMAEIQNGLKALLQTTTKNEDIFDWINAHVVEKQKREPAFIRALVSELASSAIKMKDDGVLDLDIHQFDSHCIVILRYVDSEDKLELQTLFALQAICHKLQHPPNLLNNLFRTLYEKEVISEDAFDQWKSAEVPQEMEGHAVAVKAVNQFLDIVTSKDQDDEEEAA